MCYTETLNNKGLQFFISNCFGIGFDWNDEEFIKAVNNKDQRLWEILEWAANGGAEEYNTAASFEECISGYSKDPKELLRFMYNEDNDRLDSLLENKYLSKSVRSAIEEYQSGEMSRKVSLMEPKKKQPRGGVIGFVYLILAENGLYKIGKAKNIDTRLKPFTVNFPMKWELVYNFKSNDYSAAEMKLHEVFADKRDVGEWFRLSPEDVEYITSIQDGAL